MSPTAHDEPAPEQRLLNDRMDYVRRAITARGALDEARYALKEAEKNDTVAFQAAVTTGGWTAEELRKIGLATPQKGAAGAASSEGGEEQHQLQRGGSPGTAGGTG